jgi:CRISPR-associated protein Cpf1
MGKQNGFLFYIPAWNTSKIDPITGFVNFFDTHYTSVEKAKAFFDKFKDIRFNSAKNYFEFEMDNYTNFNSKSENTRQNWIICTNSTRIHTFRNPKKLNKWDHQEIVLTDAFMNILKDHTTRIKEFILSQTEKDFFKKLLDLFKLTVQMRNSKPKTDIDYLISPVENEKGEFYDSREQKDGLPDNSDANGAYNIARKGLWAIEQIKKAEDLRKIKLAISNKEWLNFVQ